MEFKDLDFLEDLKDYLQQNISDLKKCYLFQFPQNTSFPIAILSTDRIVTRLQDIDSLRNIKFFDITFSIDVFTKQSSEEENKYVSCMKIKNTILDLLKNSDIYRNIILQLDRQLPNLNSEVCRWKLTFNCLVDAKKNIIL